MGRGRIWAEGLGLAGLGGLLFAFPTESLQAAREGVSLCLELLVPSLFPFFVLSSLLISTGLAGLCARPLTRWMEPLFGVGGAGAAALVLGLVGGYPAGARAVAQLVERGECSREEAGRLSRFCNNCGPAFFLGAVGVGVFGSQQAGLLLLGANLLAALLVGFLSARGRPRGAARPAAAPSPALSSLVTEFPGCVQSAFSATLGVCAYVILFSVLTALAEASGLLPALAGAVAHLFLGRGRPPCAGAPASGFWRSPPAPPPSGRLPPPRRPCPWRRSCWGGAGFRSTASPSPSGGRRGCDRGLISGRNASRGSWRRGSPPWPPPCCRCRYRPWRPCRRRQRLARSPGRRWRFWPWPGAAGGAFAKKGLEKPGKGEYNNPRS